MIHKSPLFFILLLLLSGCTSSLFTGDKKNDQRVSSASPHLYPCETLQLKKPEIDGTTLRSLIHCMNGNKSIDAFEVYLNQFNPQNIEAFAKVLNKELLAAPQRLFLLDKSFEQMKSNGLLDELLIQYAHLFEGKKARNASLKLLQQLFTLQGDRTKLSQPALLTTSVAARAFLNSGELRARARKAVQIAESAIAHPAWKELNQQLLKPLPTGLSSEWLNKKAFAFAISKIKENKPYLSLVVNGLADEAFVRGWNNFFHNQTEDGKTLSFDDQVHALIQLLRVLDENKSDFKNLVNFAATANAPVACAMGSKNIPNALTAALDRLSRMPSLKAPYQMYKAEMLNFKLASDACSFPAGVSFAIDFTQKLAKHSETDAEGNVIDKRPLVTMAQLAQSFKVDGLSAEEQPFWKFLANLISDDSTDGMVNALMPVLDELRHEERPVLQNFLYLADSFMNEEVREFFQFLSAPRAELGNKSAYEAAMEQLSQVDEAVWVEWISSLDEWRASERSSFSEWIAKLKQALFFNDANALLELTAKIFEEASDNKIFFEGLILTLDSTETSKALDLFAKMAEEKKLGEFFVSLSHFLSQVVSSDQRYATPLLTPVPMISSKIGLASYKDAQKWRPAPAWWPKATDSACEKIASLGSLFENHNPKWAEDLKTYFDCVSSESQLSDVPELVAFLTDPRFATKSHANLSSLLFEQVVDPFRDVDSADKFFDYLINARSKSDVRSILQYFSELSRSSAEGESFFKALFAWLSTFKNEDYALIQRWIGFLGTELKTNLNASISYFTKLSEEAPNDVLQFASKPDFADRPSVLAALRLAIREFETKNEAEVLKKMQQKEAAYFESSRNGSAYFKYASAQDFKNKFLPALNAIGDAKWPVLESALSFFKLFNGSPYDADWLESWLGRMSADVRPLGIFLSTEDFVSRRKTVLLLNNMDVLEWIAIEADFTLRELKQLGGFAFADPDTNFAIKYFTGLALGKNDLGKFVDDALDEFDYYLKMAKKPVFSPIVRDELLRRLTNLNVLLPQLKQLQIRNDLGVISDLFYSVLKATPKKNWSEYTRENNSLSVVVTLAKTGLLRTLGNGMWQRTQNSTQPELLEVKPFIELLKGLSEEKGLSILKALLQKDSLFGAASVGFDQKYQTLGHGIDLIFKWSEEKERSDWLSSSLFEVFSWLAVFDRTQLMDALSETVVGTGKLASLRESLDALEFLSESPKHANVVHRFLSERSSMPTAQKTDAFVKHALSFATAQNSVVLSETLNRWDIHRKSAEWKKMKRANEVLMANPSAQKAIEDFHGVAKDFGKWVFSENADSFALKIQDWMEVQSKQGYIVELIQGIASHPQEFDEELRRLSQPQISQSLQNLLLLVRLYMQDNFSSTPNVTH